MGVCWYCGATDLEAVYEWEHQTPLSLGEVEIGNIVGSCRSCNRLKANRTVEQFHLKIECRLREPAISASEAGPTRPSRQSVNLRDAGRRKGRTKEVG